MTYLTTLFYTLMNFFMFAKAGHLEMTTRCLLLLDLYDKKKQIQKGIHNIQLTDSLQHNLKSLCIQYNMETKKLKEKRTYLLYCCMSSAFHVGIHSA